ncbi:MAG: hypothetical protein ACW99Q_18490, partial [Candidatus Kariarchaeaceae archaeon]
WEEEIEEDAGSFTHATDSASIELETTGHYLAITGIGYQQSTSRGSHLMRLVLDGTPIETSYSYAYIRDTEWHEEGNPMSFCVFEANANDILKVQGMHEYETSTASVNTQIGKTGVMIVQLPDGDYYRGHGNDAIDPSPSGTTYGLLEMVDTEDEEDSGSFDGDLTNERVNIDDSSDYLIFFSGEGTRTSTSGTRDNTQVRLFISGTESTYGGGWYDRGTQGTMDTLEGGTSFGCFQSLTDSDYVSFYGRQIGDAGFGLFDGDQYGISLINFADLLSGGGGGSNPESQWLRAIDFGFDIPTGSTINGIEVGMDRKATISSIKDYDVRLRNSSGQVGLNKSKSGYWDLTDDDSYTLYGGSSDTWGASWSVSEINAATFGIDIAIKNYGATNEASIDHIQIKVYYTEPDTPMEDSNIVRPNGDYTTAQWEGSHGGDHADLVNEDPLDTDYYIYTSSSTSGSVSDDFNMETFSIQSGNVTSIIVKVFGNETAIDSTINVYCNGWLGSKPLNMESGQGWYSYTWSGLTKSQSDLDDMRVEVSSVQPPSASGPSLIGQFSALEGASNKFSYNWTNLETVLSNYETGDEINITVEVIDNDSGNMHNITYACILDFELPTSIITIGDGATDYSLNNYAAPWTSIDLSASDNMQGIIDQIDYYYEEEVFVEYQVNVVDMNNISLYTSGFSPLSGAEATLFDLGIPVNGFEDHTQYYYTIEFRITDAAGNMITNSSYLGDSYSFDAGIPRILVSNEVTIQFDNNLINVNDLYSQIGNIVNFTLHGADNSELKNHTISVKSGNYYLEATLWNENTQKYEIVFDSLDDLILYSENIFENELTANYPLDFTLNWDAQGTDYYAFAKHASQEDPLVLSYALQEERYALMEISEKEGFRLPDYLNYSEVFCFLYNEATEKYDTKHNFNEDDFTVLANGSVAWNVNLSVYDAKDDIVVFRYWGSDHAEIIKDTQKDGMFMKILVPNIYSTHCTVERLQIIFTDFEDNRFVYSMDSLDFDKYFENAAQYKRVIPGLSELLEIPIY